MKSDKEFVKLSCPTKGASARASSSWQHDEHQFGPQHALDSQSMHAWKSAPSSEGANPLAYYEIYFHRPVCVREIRLQFQGGFVGMDCIAFTSEHELVHGDKCATGAETNVKEIEWNELEELFLDTIESNDVQIFRSTDEDNATDKKDEYYSALRIEFGKSTDFYGRIVVYSLEVWGFEL